MRMSTINQVVETILGLEPDKPERGKRIANEATIYLKTALLCEDEGIDKAMKYFIGTHSEDEYKEWRTEVFSKTFDPTEISLCKNCWCATHTMTGNICGKCHKPKM